MVQTHTHGSHLMFATAIAGALVIGGLANTGTASAASPTSVGLGTASSFAVLAGTGVTNEGATTIDGDLGTHPTPAVTGFPPGIVHGTVHAADAVAGQAKDDLTAAYLDAAGRTPTDVIQGELGGRTLVAGVYASGGATLGLTGTLTLDGQHDPASVWIFQASSDLVTASSSSVSFINGAQPCNVFWQVTSSATLGSGSSFGGSILALTSITMGSGVFLGGRALARNGTVTLIGDAIAISWCGTSPGPPPPPMPLPTPGPPPYIPPGEGPHVPPTALPPATASPYVPPTASPPPSETAPTAPTASPAPAASPTPTKRPTPPPTSTPPPTGGSSGPSAPALLIAGSVLFLFGVLASRGLIQRRQGATDSGR